METYYFILDNLEIIISIIIAIKILLLVSFFIILHNISKHTKKTYEEIEKLNKNIYNVIINKN